ncbi:amino acid ABC transporter permease [Burkholderia cepacia]|uniref:amino acid ABC transporter permease n=1 Tax=Burkholderia cepacia TaxID=292 RepID=UPI002AB724A9|nr:ABC transporter permease subunit [Burkholderia cepacia]
MTDQLAALWPVFGHALALTVALTLATLVLGVPFALAVGAALDAGSSIARAYVDVAKKLPLVVKLFALFFILRVDAYVCAVVALVLHQVGFAADILRGGLTALPGEIDEAARTTGLSGMHRFWRIRLPLALRHVAPALVLQSVEVVKNTSIVSLIGLVEVTGAAEAYQSETFQYGAGFAVGALAYVALVLPLMLMGRSLEKRVNRGGF